MSIVTWIFFPVKLLLELRALMLLSETMSMFFINGAGLWYVQSSW